MGKVHYITKSYNNHKAYRPIYLTTFLMKVVEKIIYRHIEDFTIAERPGFYAQRYAVVMLVSWSSNL